MGVTTGASPSLEDLNYYSGEDLVAALESRSLVNACLPLRRLQVYDNSEDGAILKRLFACCMLASVEELILEGAGKAWMTALVTYLEKGLDENRPRSIKIIRLDFNDDYYSPGDAEPLVSVLARGGAPELRILDGVESGENGVSGVIWSSQATSLFRSTVIGKEGACPKLYMDNPTPWLWERRQDYF